MEYSRLFSPMDINSLHLKNRIVMTAIQCNYTPNGYASDVLTEFYRERARGGAGLIIAGGCRFDDLCGSTPEMMSLKDDSYIDGYKAFTDEIHRCGAKIAVQLYHAGRYAKGRYLNGGQALSPSATFSTYTRETAREMTPEDIRATISHWAEGAVRAKKAGFDAIEVVASAGYLICQFLSPLTNQRTDCYGGSWENRTRFPLELLHALREAVGEDYPIIFRISGNDFVPGSNTNIDAVRFAKLLDENGVDLISVTGGWHETKVPQLPGEVPTGMFTYLAAAVKDAVSCPVLSSNRQGDPRSAENLLAMGSADLVGLCRTLVADPEWPDKVREGRTDEIRPCVGCNQGCLASTFFGKSVQCLTNGRAGREYAVHLAPAGTPQRILVVGGGPAGCECALRAAQRGHSVVLAEASGAIGGWVDVVAAPPGKHDFHKLVPYYETMLAKAGVRVLLRHTVTADEAMGYDKVVVASGGSPMQLRFDTDGSVDITTAVDVLKGECLPGRRVVVVGGGAVGTETVQYLAHESSLNAEQLYFLSVHQAETPEKIAALLNTSRREISVVEIAEKAFGGFDLGCSWPVVKDLKRYSIPIYTSTAVSSIRDGVVLAKKTNQDGSTEEISLPCDTLIIAAGTVPNTKLYDELVERGHKQVRLIGNAVKTGRILDAIHQAIDCAAEL